MQLTRRQLLQAAIGAAVSSGTLLGSGNVWGQTAAGKKAYGICIGLSRVSGAGYWNGWTGELQGTIPDAELYENTILPGANRFKLRRLHDNQADAKNVYRHILWAANDLQSGDLLVVTYAGHGMQVPDESGDEDDRNDEAMCLWDRPLLDDELSFMWSFFRPGVRIVMVSDSCHSGTQGREFHVLADLKAIQGRRDQSTASRAAQLRSSQGVSRGMPQDRAAVIDSKTTLLQKIFQEDDSRANSSIDDLVKSANQQSKAGVRRVPQKLAAALATRDRQATQPIIASAVRAMDVRAGKNDGRAEIAARVVTISGCQDNEVSMEEGGHGVFTSTLFAVWNSGKFRGTYEQFANEIKSAMPPNQQPKLDAFGQGTGFEKNEQPFQL